MLIDRGDKGDVSARCRLADGGLEGVMAAPPR